MRFGDFLRATVLLSAGAATLLAALAVIGLSREYDRTLANGEKPEWRENIDFPSELFEMEERAKQRFTDITFDQDIPPQVESGVAISSVVELSRVAWQKFVDNFDRFRSDLMTDCLVIAQSRYGADRLMKYRGTMGWEPVGDFTGADLRNQTDVVVKQSATNLQTRPQIDLIASYTLAGAAGNFNPNFVNPLGSSNSSLTLNQAIANLNQITMQDYPNLPQIQPVVITQTPPIPDYLVGGYGSALGNLFANRFPTFRVGLQFNLPLFGDKTAKAQFGRSLVEGDRLKTQREQLEQNIQVDVRNALQSVRTAEARLRAAAISRENSVKQYESEQRKLDNGQSDVYRVLERQTAVTVARSNELRAQTELNKAIADLQRATGNSLKANNVEARLRH